MNGTYDTYEAMFCFFGEGSSQKMEHYKHLGEGSMNQIHPDVCSFSGFQFQLGLGEICPFTSRSLKQLVKPVISLDVSF